MYHRIASLASDPYGICVSPENFAEDLEVIRRRANPISLTQLQASLVDGRLPKRAVVLTFDDGYADMLHAARPLLERFEVPATVFVVSSLLHQTREFWWDELEKIILQPDRLPPVLSLQSGATPVHFDASGPREQFFWAVYGHLRGHPPQERECAMQQLHDWTGRQPNMRPTHRGLTPDELIRLADGGLVEIGGHTDTHVALATLPAQSQQSEISAGKAKLEEVLGKRITSFSYPHGSYTSDTVAAVKNAGFRCACTTLGQMARPKSPAYEIPRISIKNAGKGRLKHKLAGWL
jgi:peptidoglycan/xylan/chitin deacetylase (PgdA/CDA1 family)